MNIILAQWKESNIESGVKILQQKEDINSSKSQGCGISYCKHGRIREMLTKHSATCGGECTLQGETMHSGLAVVLSAVCSKCKQLFTINTSKRLTMNKSKKWAINVAAVLGQMSTGGGLARLNNALAMMDVPSMSKRLYTATERYLGDEMKQQLVAAMAETAKEEKEHAIANNMLHQDIPAVKVIVDGGWSKRSHKHSYNAKSGVAVIFGHYTKKLLFLGVRNKFCSVCAIAENKGQEPPQHKCYKNWNGSSPAMETDILCEGFRLSETQYGIRYLYVIGDGDSSVMANIRQSVS